MARETRPIIAHDLEAFRQALRKFSGCDLVGDMAGRMLEPGLSQNALAARAGLAHHDRQMVERRRETQGQGTVHGTRPSLKNRPKDRPRPV